MRVLSLLILCAYARTLGGYGRCYLPTTPPFGRQWSVSVLGNHVTRHGVGAGRAELRWQVAREPLLTCTFVDQESS